MLTPADMAGNGGEGSKDLSPLDLYLTLDDPSKEAPSEDWARRVVRKWFGEDAVKQYEAGLRETTED